MKTVSIHIPASWLKWYYRLSWLFLFICVFNIICFSTINWNVAGIVRNIFGIIPDIVFILWFRSRRD